MFVHTALLQGLREGVKYKYYVGSTPFFSDVKIIDFPTPQSRTTVSNNTYTLAAFGDWGVGYLGRQTLNSLEQQLGHYDAVLLFGDMAYTLDSDDGQLGDEFLREIEPISSEVPLMVIPGNQEDSRNFSQVLGRFSMPNNEYNEGTGLFYSFDLGQAHFVMFTTEFYFLEGMEDIINNQMAFLIEDLTQANANRHIRPWVVALSHRPLYCSLNHNKACQANAVLMQNEFESLFHSQGVDLYFSGHVHYYERTTAVYQNQTVTSGKQTENSLHNAGATVYIVSGAAGSNEKLTPVPSVLSNFTVLVKSEVGYGLLEVHNSTLLYWRQFNAASLTMNDYFYLSKNTTRPF